MSFVRYVAALLIFLYIPAALYARDIAITVEDEELAMPLEGAVVSLRNGQQFVCDEDGKAQVSLSDERQQVILITYPGYETKRVNIPPQESGIEHITVSLRLSGVMQGRELVVEAQRPETSETKSGRSVAISDKELARTAEIGIIEDVMSSVKLLPGVGYTGMFGAMPSIRGGDPGDLMASFDGFYLERPYHWVGAVSIFDPKMVSSARLSHGVFSSRYGHTVSGLLEITSKSPSSTEIEMETAISTSAASLNLSFPLNGRGGILFMGKVTYWDTLVWAAKGLSKVVDNENLALINSVSTAPYIRSAAVAVDYRFSPDLEWRLNAFFGSDGVGAASTVNYQNEEVNGSVDFAADYNNYQGFLISGITASPSSVLAIKATGGVGFTRTITDDMMKNNVTVKYSDDFLALFPGGPPFFIKEMLSAKGRYTAPDDDINVVADHTIFNAQARGDLDWDLGKGFIAAFGVQELYSLWAQNQDINFSIEIPLAELSAYVDQLAPEIQAMLNDPAFSFLHNIDDLAIIRPMGFNSELFNHGLSTSAYGLVEYSSPNRRFGAELGLRLDHLYFRGKDFIAQTKPALNPRLNIDINILKNKGIIDSLDFTAGTGLFSSINSLISFIDMKRVILNETLKFNRAWTSIAGIKVDFEQGYSFNIEGYYKYIFDRAYLTADILSSPNIRADFYSDGIGHVGGFDLQLQKMESRYFDGWISYTFTWAKYYDPHSGDAGLNMGDTGSEGAQWYYPSFHRFHNCNIVLNFKPLRWFNIVTRFGFASGQMRNRTKYDDVIYAYPVLYLKEDGETEIIQKYRRKELYEYTERAPWSFPWDLKFSFFLFDKKGRVGTEIYLAAENLISLFYSPRRDDGIRFNEYTGKVDDSGSGRSFDFPIPLVSFGFKWRY
jgi:hypothetical protein